MTKNKIEQIRKYKGNIQIRYNTLGQEQTKNYTIMIDGDCLPPGTFTKQEWLEAENEIIQFSKEDWQKITDAIENSSNVEVWAKEEQ